MAMTEITLRQPLRYTIDLSAGLVQQPMRSQLMKGDKKANRVIVHLTDGGKDAALSGVTVTGSFIRPPDSAEIPLKGEASGSEASVTLEDACYATEGYCEISVRLTVGETSRTILTLTGYVLSKGSGAYVDVSGVIPNIDDIIAQYAEMKAVTERTLAAAQRAEALAIDASGYAANTGMLGGQTPSYYAKQETVNQLSEQIVDYWKTVYPVGSIYMSVNETSPAALFGGTWEQIKGRMLIGTGTPEANDDGTSPGSYNMALGSKGGSSTQRLTDPAQNAYHQHTSGNTNKMGNIGYHASEPDENSTEANFAVLYDFLSPRTDLYLQTSYSGEGAPFGIMNPYIAVNMWKRVA